MQIVLSLYVAGPQDFPAHLIKGSIRSESFIFALLPHPAGTMLNKEPRHALLLSFTYIRRFWRYCLFSSRRCISRQRFEGNGNSQAFDGGKEDGGKEKAGLESFYFA